MCSIDLSHFSFTLVSNRKGGHDRTEKLCLLTRMRGPSGGESDRAVGWPTAALNAGFTEALRCMWWGVRGAIHLGALVGTPKCVCHRCVLPPSLLK